MTFYEMINHLKQGEKMCNTNKLFWGDNFIYIQLVDSTIINKDLDGNTLNETSNQKVILTLDTEETVDYNFQNVDILSNDWSIYEEE